MHLVSMAASVAWLLALPLLADTPRQTDWPFALSIQPGVFNAATKRVNVEWRVENISDKPSYICQWPGMAFYLSWDCRDGKGRGIGPGYPSCRTLERRYFIEVKPGEALIGYSEVGVFPTPTGTISIKGQFRCDQSGDQHGLTAWHGRMESQWKEVTVPVEADAPICKE